MTDIFLYHYTNTAVGAILSLIRTWEPCWSEHNSWREEKRVGWSLMEQMIGLRFKERVREETPKGEKLD